MGPVSTPTKLARKSCERGSIEPSSFIATPNTSEKPSIPARFSKGTEYAGRKNVPARKDPMAMFGFVTGGKMNILNSVTY